MAPNPTSWALCHHSPKQRRKVARREGPGLMVKEYTVLLQGITEQGQTPQRGVGEEEEDVPLIPCEEPAHFITVGRGGRR